MTLPNLLVIGAQKSGTTSLHRYLAAHPEVFMTARKELDYFSGPGWNWERGHEWYEAQFEGAEGLPARGESSPSYSMHPWVPGVPERIRDAIPDARIVYVVRDPIDRMVSQYVHYLSRGYVRKSFAELVADPGFGDSDYVAFSRYATQLERYLAEFPRERIHVIDHADLRSRRTPTLAALFEFLGVDPGFSSETFDATYNEPRNRVVQRTLNRVSGGRFNAARFDALGRRLPWLRRLDAKLARPMTPPELAPATRERMVELIGSDADRLRRVTGMRLESWSV